MKTTSKNTAAVTTALDARLAMTVQLQRDYDRIGEMLSAERAVIKDLMEAGELTRYASPQKHEALLIDNTAFVWNAVALEAVLEAEEMEEFVPRKPEAAKLRKHFESDDGFAERVKKCFKRRNSVKLEIRSAGMEVKSQTPNENAA